MIVELVYMQYNISDSQVLFWCFVLIILRVASLGTLFLCSVVQQAWLSSQLAYIVLKFFTKIVAPWCSGYHHCTILFNKASIQALRRFKSCSRSVGDSQWLGSLTMFPVGNKAKILCRSTIPTKTIHQFVIIKLPNITFTITASFPKVTSIVLKNKFLKSR